MSRVVRSALLPVLRILNSHTCPCIAPRFLPFCHSHRDNSVEDCYGRQLRGHGSGPSDGRSSALEVAAKVAEAEPD